MKIYDYRSKSRADQEAILNDMLLVHCSLLIREHDSVVFAPTVQAAESITIKIEDQLRSWSCQYALTGFASRDVINFGTSQISVLQANSGSGCDHYPFVTIWGSNFIDQALLQEIALIPAVFRTGHPPRLVYL